MFTLVTSPTITNIGDRRVRIWGKWCNAIRNRPIQEQSNGHKYYSLEAVMFGNASEFVDEMIDRGEHDMEVIFIW